MHCLLLFLQAAVEVFVLVQDLLPAVSALNQKYAPPTFNPNQSTDSTTGNQPEQGLSACTTSNHYSVIESDHPYKQASVTQYRVSCPLSCFLLAMSTTKQRHRYFQDSVYLTCSWPCYRYHFQTVSAGPQ